MIPKGEERILRERAVDFVHQFQRLSIHTNGHVVQRRPADLQQFALAGQAQIRVIIALRSLGLIASARVTKKNFQPSACQSSHEAL